MLVYNEEYSKVEVEYYNKYKEKRDELLSCDVAEREKATSDLKKELKIALDNQSYSYENLQYDNTVVEELKNINDVNAMIEYYETGRVETLKEAINLLFDEKRKDEEEQKQEEYRQEMLRLQREQLEATEEAAYYARQAAVDAEAALKEARNANYN